MQSKLQIQPDKHIPQLDGLRGIAILMVMCYHFFPNNIVCSFGWSGVDLFFVLSGFLITGRLIPYIDDKNILYKFYRNRFLRIVPLYFGFITIFFAVWFVLVSMSTRLANPFYSNYWWGFYLFLQNWVYIFNPQQSIDHLNHLWSLAAEEQFYLIFPFLVLVLRKPKKIFNASLFLITSILLLRIIFFLYFNTEKNYQLIYWNTFFRADSFLTGCVLYLLVKYYQAKKIYLTIWKYVAVAAFIFLLAGVYQFKSLHMSNPFFETIGYSLISIVFGFILLKSIGNTNKVLNYITSNKTLVFCGKISYGLYVFHWPIYLSGYVVWNKIFKNQPALLPHLHTLNVLYSIVVTFVASYLSFKYFESYFLKKKVGSV